MSKRTCLNCGHEYFLPRNSGDGYKKVQNCHKCTKYITDESVEMILEDFKTGELWK